MPVRRGLFEMSGLGARPNGENRPQWEILTRDSSDYLIWHKLTSHRPVQNRAVDPTPLYA